jgi:PEP-CTERM/exosortase A-associated glycosyltransferase
MINQMRILHLLHRSLPGTHGYAIRSKEIVNNQLAGGLEPMILTSPSQAPAGRLDAEQSETIDGVRYFRTGGGLLPATLEVSDASRLKSGLRIIQNIFMLKRANELISKYHPEVIHAHSPFTCGIIGDLTGKFRHIPTIYEVRGIWEDSHTARYNLHQRSLRYRALRELESRAIRWADLCIVIGEGLRSELISRGILEKKIRIVPNGVDVMAFKPGPAPTDLRERLGLVGRRVLGYIGSFFSYEGLDLMVRAMGPLSQKFPDLALMLVGLGEAEPQLRAISGEVGIADRVIFAGKVSHTQVVDYYRICDAIVLPRRESRETRLVTPLKPLEVMAMAKPLILSNIGGHREMVISGENGIFFKTDDVKDLVIKCSELLENTDLMNDLGQKGRYWVQKNRSWSELVQKYVEIYEELTEPKQTFE